MQQHTVLLATNLLSDLDIRRMGERAKLYRIEEVEKNDSILPSIEVMIIGRWPKILDANNVAKLKSLRMVQCIFAGVDMLPFNLVPKDAIICSNAGAYSFEVAEHAVALMLSAAHSVSHFSIVDSFALDEASALTRLSRTIFGKTIGIIGYGGIGKAFESMLKGFEVRILAYVRNAEAKKEVEVKEQGHVKGNAVIIEGRKGLEELLKESDVVLLAMPLTKNTRGLIGRKELEMMKEDAMLVNVARGEIVDADSVADHLKSHPRFIYATDVGWRINGKETGNPSGRFTGLRNYLTTPHIAGLLSSSSGRPSAQATENVLRFFDGKEPINQVNKDEYLGLEII